MILVDILIINYPLFIQAPGFLNFSQAFSEISSKRFRYCLLMNNRLDWGSIFEDKKCYIFIKVSRYICKLGRTSGIPEVNQIIHSD